MSYRPTTLQKILNLFKGKEKLWVTQLSQRSWLSRTIIHKYIKVLVEQGELTKSWVWPRVFYQLADHNVSDQKEDVSVPIFDYATKNLLDDIFLKFSPTGEKMLGATWLAQWCKKRDLDPKEKATAYINIYKHIQSLRDDCGLLDATDAFEKNVDTYHMTATYYADQYKWMDFGRGKLAELTFYGKQSQSRTLIDESVGLFVDKITCFVRQRHIDAIAFVPPSISRQQQLLYIINTHIDQTIPRIHIEKFYTGDTKIPQKSLKKRADRIENAQKTIYVRDETTKNYKTVLLIDDFVGSGATLNETAKKLKQEGVDKVIGFAIVGNMDLKYEVINEM